MMLQTHAIHFLPGRPKVLQSMGLVYFTYIYIVYLYGKRRRQIWLTEVTPGSGSYPKMQPCK